MQRLLLVLVVVAVLVAGCTSPVDVFLPSNEATKAVVGGNGGADMTGDEQVKTLRVMTFNIHWGSGPDGVLDLEQVARVIRSARADIVGLQEVDRHWGARSDYLDEAAELATLLGTEYAYGPALRRISFSDRFDTGYFGNAVLSRYPIIEAENHILERRGTAENRAFLHTVIDVGGLHVNFISTHLGLDVQERVAHVGEILKHINELDGPSFLVGDWNATPDKPEVRLVAEKMTDCAAEAGKERDYTFPYKPSIPGVPNVRIDYVFASGVEVKDSTVIDTDASDHRPVVVDVSLPAESRGKDMAQVSNVQ